MFENRRILIIDDSIELLEEMSRILEGKDTAYLSMEDWISAELSSADGLQEQESALPMESYEIATTSSGKHGFEMVAQSSAEGRPFAVAFVDMRMPGWDGIKTVKEIKGIDDNIEVVIITAYEDYKRREILPQIGSYEKILILKKPFSRDELMQIALSLTTKWNTEQALRERNKSLENALIESKQLRQYLKSIISFMPSILISVDTEGRISQWNHKAEEWTGISQDAASGQVLWDICPCFSNYKDTIISTITSEKTTNLSQEKIGEDGNCIIANMTFFSLWTDRVEGAVITIEDITKKVELEKQLLQAHRMEGIGMLAGGVAHDFNNLLTAILGNADLAMMKINKADPVFWHLKRLQHAGLRAADLTRQLLVFSRKQPMEHTPTNVNAGIDNLLKMLRRLIGEDIEIVTVLAPDIWAVLGDAGNIEQVVMNLSVNARDAMADGGRLLIKTENIVLDEGRSRDIPEARPGRFVRISVCDSGIGMDKETIQHIFEPFFSTKAAGKGTGLGLSVVHGIVKQHNGWINVHSKPGEGTTFDIYLPAFSGTAEPEPEGDISLKAFQGNGERILLVEDDETVRKLAMEVLDENGYVVFEAASAKEAIAIFEREKGKFDLLFSDVVLPDESGIQLINQLIERNPEPGVLLTSGYTDHKSQWRDIKERGLRFLGKPYPLPDLFKAVKEAIADASSTNKRS